MSAAEPIPPPNGLLTKGFIVSFTNDDDDDAAAAALSDFSFDFVLKPLENGAGVADAPKMPDFEASEVAVVEEPNENPPTAFLALLSSAGFAPNANAAAAGFSEKGPEETVGFSVVVVEPSEKAGLSDEAAAAKLGIGAIDVDTGLDFAPNAKAELEGLSAGFSVVAPKLKPTGGAADFSSLAAGEAVALLFTPKTKPGDFVSGGEPAGLFDADAPKENPDGDFTSESDVLIEADPNANGATVFVSDSVELFGGAPKENPPELSDAAAADAPKENPPLTEELVPLLAPKLNPPVSPKLGLLELLFSPVFSSATAPKVAIFLAGGSFDSSLLPKTKLPKVDLAGSVAAGAMNEENEDLLGSLLGEDAVAVTEPKAGVVAADLRNPNPPAAASEAAGFPTAENPPKEEKAFFLAGSSPPMLRRRAFLMTRP